MPPNEDNSHYEKILATGEVKCIDDEIPFEIPENWAWVRYREIANCLLGKTKNPHQLSGTICPYLCSINVYWGKIKLSEIKEMLFSDTDMRQYSVHKGDMLICEGGEAGRTAIYNGEIEPMYFQNALHRVRFYGNISAHFYLHQMEFYKKMGLLNDHIKGETIQHFVLGKLQNLIVPLPPLAEQQRIVEKLETLLPLVEQFTSDQIKLNTLNNEISALLKKSILQEAIQGKLVPLDSNDEPASLLLDRIREEKKKLVACGKLKKKDLTDSTIFKGDDNKYYEQIGGKCLDITQEIPFDIPNSWVWTRIKCIYQTSSGGTPEKGHPEYYGGTIPWVKVGDLSNIYISQTEDSISDLGLANSSAKLFPKDTILVAMYCNDAIGKSSILLSSMTTNQAICGLYPNPFLNTEYIYYAIQNNRKNLQEHSAGGAQKNINQKIVNNMLIPIPPIEEQMRIVEKIQRLYKKL